MACLWIFHIIFLSSIIKILSATSTLRGLEVYNELEESCPQILSLCTFKVGGVNFIKLPAKGPDGNKGDRGNEGERTDGLSGDRGVNGIDGQQGSKGLPGARGAVGTRGEKGDKGWHGPPGNPGFDMTKGLNGDAGVKGVPGQIGSMGGKGRRGDVGPVGPQGMIGKKGVIGDTGNVGPTGMPGSPGKPGYCPCEYSDDDSYGSSGFGSRETPGIYVCKASPETLQTGLYYVGPGPTEVQCVTRPNMSTLTCIPPAPEKLKTITYTDQGWLSQKNLTIEDIYGVTREQLAWIQRRSGSAFQTIRYHCLNSNPFPRDNVEKSVQLLSWNDKIIGPLPTLTMPFFYSVVTDGCSKAKGKWSYTDIKLVSYTNQRVPVIDFLVKPIRLGNTHSVKIEHIELCFD